MSLFQCDECGCCENTALCNYHWRKYKKQRGLCSACEAREDGKEGDGWHGLFDRVFLPKGEFRTNARGNLEHRETGDEDFQKFALPVGPNASFSGAASAVSAGSDS